MTVLSIDGSCTAEIVCNSSCRYFPVRFLPNFDLGHTTIMQYIRCAEAQDERTKWKEMGRELCSVQHWIERRL